MLGILFGAAILGIIIAVMEQERFPGWGRMIGCVLAPSITAFFINLLLPKQLFFIGSAVGALSAVVVISYLCDMSLGRAGIAASIYWAILTAISLACYLMFGFF